MLQKLQEMQFIANCSYCTHTHAQAFFQNTQLYVTWWIRRSPSGTALCSRNMPTYSLPAFCCDFTSRVARSMQTIRQPVTFGSSVPLCPVFSTLRIRLIHATTSWEDGFDGLSRLMNPLLETGQCSIRRVTVKFIAAECRLTLTNNYGHVSIHTHHAIKELAWLTGRLCCQYTHGDQCC